MDSAWKVGIAVGIGGATGAVCRYIVGLYAAALGPCSTLLVNVVGSLLLGMLMGYSLKRKVKEWRKAGIGTGFCGGLTTMSAFSKEVVHLIEQGDVLIGIGYAAVSVSGSLLCCFVGIRIGTLAGRRRSTWK